MLFSTSFPSPLYLSVSSKIFASSPFIFNARYKHPKKFKPDGLGVLAYKRSLLSSCDSLHILCRKCFLRRNSEKAGLDRLCCTETRKHTTVHACMAHTEARVASCDGCGYACACWSWLLFDLCRKAEVFRKSCSLNSDVISLSRRPSSAYLLWAALYEHPNELNIPDLSDHFGIISIFFAFHERKNLLDKVSRWLWLSLFTLIYKSKRARGHRNSRQQQRDPCSQLAKRGSICRAVGACEKQGNSVICGEENKFSFEQTQKPWEKPVSEHLQSIFFHGRKQLNFKSFNSKMSCRSHNISLFIMLLINVNK